MKTVALIVGTRPEAIKMAPVYFALRDSPAVRPLLLSTGQHRQMLDQTLAVFGLKPDVDLGLMKEGQTLPDLTARILSAVTEFLDARRPDAVLVQGDTTTVLSSSLAAFYAGIPVGHVEAGLRTHDLGAPWPEEMNRRLTDQISRWCFAPTELSRDNLLREQLPEANIHVTGNTVIDALIWTRSRLDSDGVDARTIAGSLGISERFTNRFLAGDGDPWILVTGHRRESFGGGFERICEGIRAVADAHPDLGILYPVHLNPRVRAPVAERLSSHERIELVEPAAYQDFVWLMDRCHFLVSDSGGVQEEAPGLGKPVLVMRDSTERPEGVDAGTCTLVGTDPEKILAEASALLLDEREYRRRCALKNPYGDGTASIRIREVLDRELGCL